MTMRRRKEHRPEEVVAKLRVADAMFNAGKESRGCRCSLMDGALVAVVKNSLAETASSTL